MNSRRQQYQDILQQAESVLESSLGQVGKMATLVALLHENMAHFDWTGFYCTNDSGILEIGPYQGHLACLFIPFGKGVCGVVAEKRRTLIVDDVTQFEGYIACDGETQSEIVVPLVRGDRVVAVLDVDSHQRGAFTKDDQDGLEQLLKLL